MTPVWIGLWAFLVFSPDYGNVNADDPREGVKELTQLEKLGMAVEGYSDDTHNVVEDPGQNLGPRPCAIPFKKIGCYKDKTKKSKRAMSELLFQDRYKGKTYSGRKVDWKNWATYLPEFVCRCAQAAANKGYTFYGVQYYGECWSCADAGRKFFKYGQGTGCVDTSYKECVSSNDVPCVGKNKRNFMYEIVEEAESGGGQPVNPEE